MPWAISISLDTVLRNLGNVLLFERWGDELEWEIYCHPAYTNADGWLHTTIQHGYIPVQDSNDEIFEQ